MTIIATIEIDATEEEVKEAGSVGQAVQNKIGHTGAVVTDAEKF